MNEYSRIDDIEIVRRAQTAWSATCEALPVGTQVTGEVIGRQPFGVFLRIDGAPDALGLADVWAIPQGELPPMGARVSGEVRWLWESNHQVKITLSEWWPART